MMYFSSHRSVVGAQIKVIVINRSSQRMKSDSLNQFQNHLIQAKNSISSTHQKIKINIIFDLPINQEGSRICTFTKSDMKWPTKTLLHSHSKYFGHYSNILELNFPLEYGRITNSIFVGLCDQLGHFQALEPLDGQHLVFYETDYCMIWQDGEYFHMSLIGIYSKIDLFYEKSFYGSKN